MRRQGQRIPWSNPKQLREFLEPLRGNAQLSDASTFSSDDLERGVIVHLGSHVAALMEDRPPLGLLNGEDIVAHQLEGAPALLTLAELLRQRGQTRFDVLRVPRASAKIDLLVGGDVMLGRTVGEHISAGVDPFADIRSLLDRADFKMANLECVTSSEGTFAPKKVSPSCSAGSSGSAARRWLEPAGPGE